MEFIFNSRQRKVEVFYNNASEQQALFEFLSQWMTYKEDKSSTICDDKGITWTTSNIPDNILINYDDTLVSVMTFCRPRFNASYEWELSRFCSKEGLKIRKNA